MSRMRPEEYVAFDAVDLAALAHRGEVTALELDEAAMGGIEAVKQRLNAVVERNYDRARDAAAAMDLAAPLAGVPFLPKDINIEVAGMHLPSSCRWLEGLPPAAEDAPLAARWRSAGLSLLGRTNTPEFATEFVCEPTWRGSTQNPWDLSLTPGGSSGGAAGGVASGILRPARPTPAGGSSPVAPAARRPRR